MTSPSVRWCVKNGAYDEIGLRSTIAELATLDSSIFPTFRLKSSSWSLANQKLRVCTPGQDQPAPIKGSIEDPASPLRVLRLASH